MIHSELTTIQYISSEQYLNDANDITYKNLENSILEFDPLRSCNIYLLQMPRSEEKHSTRQIHELRHDKLVKIFDLSRNRVNKQWQMCRNKNKTEDPTGT